MILEHGQRPNALADMAAQLGGSATSLYSGPEVAQIALPDQFLAAEIKMRLPWCITAIAISDEATILSFQTILKVVEWTE